MTYRTFGFSFFALCGFNHRYNIKKQKGEL